MRHYEALFTEIDTWLYPLRYFPSTANLLIQQFENVGTSWVPNSYKCLIFSEDLMQDKCSFVWYLWQFFLVSTRLYSVLLKSSILVKVQVQQYYLNCCLFHSEQNQYYTIRWLWANNILVEKQNSVTYGELNFWICTILYFYFKLLCQKTVLCFPYFFVT